MAGAQQAKSQSCTTLKKTPLVYMASQTALICKCYAAECTKTRAKILQPENSKKEKNAPEIVRKRRNRVRFGCWRGWERLWAGANGWESLAIGQKDLVSAPLRSARGRAPLALARPSARGFGVDVGERTREREKADVIRFPPQVPERAVLVWCCELFLEKDCVSTTTSSFERKAPPPGGWPS